jgi:D-inositol-3-phosphate glycosyltransferase
LPAINYYGDPHIYPWKIYPAEKYRGDFHGERRILELAKEIKPHGILILNDIWVILTFVETLKSLDSKIQKIIYTPIDSDPVEPQAVLPLLQIIDQWVTFTQFGKTQLQNAILSSKTNRVNREKDIVKIIPHGVDKSHFYPINDGTSNSGPRTRIKARKSLFQHSDKLLDAFIALNANRNQPRKCIDTTIEGFAIFARNKPNNVKLYLHMGREDLGWDIQILSERFSISQRVLFSTLQNKMPNFNNEKLNLVYNSCDVGVNTSSAEGWGLVSFEHAATAAAQIVPNHTSQKELWSGSAMMINPSFLTTTPRVLTNAYLISPEALAKNLEDLYQNPKLRKSLEDKAYLNACSSEYDWQEISKLLIKLLLSKV